MSYYEEDALKIAELQERNMELEKEIQQLKATLVTKEANFATLLESQKKPRRSTQAKNDKNKYYHEHKNDPDILSQVESFSKTYPGVKVPWYLIKKMTNEKMCKKI